MSEIKDEGYLRIENEADRLVVASILYKNRYAITPVRVKKNGKTYEYLLKFKRVVYDQQEATVSGNEN